jgi:hypothetical protein
LIKQVGKGLGTIVLLCSCALLAAYAEDNFPGWAFGLSLLLLVAGAVPMVLFFNLFRDQSTTPIKSFEFQEPTDDWSDLFSPWHRDRDDD